MYGSAGFQVAVARERNLGDAVSLVCNIQISAVGVERTAGNIDVGVSMIGEEHAPADSRQTAGLIERRQAGIVAHIHHAANFKRRVVADAGKVFGAVGIPVARDCNIGVSAEAHRRALVIHVNNGQRSAGHIQNRTVRACVPAQTGVAGRRRNRSVVGNRNIRLNRNARPPFVGRELAVAAIVLIENEVGIIQRND